MCKRGFGWVRRAFRWVGFVGGAWWSGERDFAGHQQTRLRRGSAGISVGWFRRARDVFGPTELSWRCANAVSGGFGGHFGGFVSHRDVVCVGSSFTPSPSPLAEGGGEGSVGSMRSSRM